MSETSVRTIVLFFYLLLLDEEKTIAASAKTAALVSERRRRSPQAKEELLVLHALLEIFPGFAAIPANERRKALSWPMPAGLEFGTWREFHRAAPLEEKQVVVLVSVLNFPEEDVAAALGLSAGTVRYRLGRGLSRLGANRARVP